MVAGDRQEKIPMALARLSEILPLVVKVYGRHEQ
jgi:hypothetical protein